MKKIISLILCAVMLFTAVVPFTAFAEGEENIEISAQNDEQNNDIAYKKDGAFIYTVLRSEPAYAVLTEYDRSVEPEKKNIVIPSTLGGKKVREIGSCFMMYDKKVESVTIPETVINIERDAFSECEKLSKIKIEGEPSHIGWNAFINTAYYNNASKWKNGALYIGKNLISGSHIKGAYKIKNGTVTIADGAMFCNVGNKPNKMTSLVVPDSVKYIGQDAFLSCVKCKKIKLGKGIRFIGRNAFNNTGYAKIKKNYKNGVFYIGKYLIASTKNPEKVTVKKGTVLIAASAFDKNNKSKLKEIIIPDSVKYINDGAFYNCKKLGAVKLGKKVRKIGDEAFVRCTGVKAYTIDKKNKYYCSASGVLFNKKKTVLIAYPVKKDANSYKLPKSVIRIKKFAFAYAKKLKKVEFNNKLKYIDVYAFISCTAMKSVTVPKNVKYIGFGAIGVVETSDVDGYYYAGLKDFTIKGYKATAAQRYAETFFDDGEDHFGPFRFVEIN